jgi:hypothetical protein
MPTDKQPVHLQSDQFATSLFAYQHREDVLKHGPVTKRLSARFGSKRARRNQLVSRLKRSRQYKPPVRGGRKNRRGFRAR